MNPEHLKRILWKFPTPLFVAAAYLYLGFVHDLWHPGWMLFLLIPAYYMCVAMYAAKGLRRKLNIFPIHLVCTAAYLYLGFIRDLWHPGWIIFLLIPLYYWIVNAFVEESGPGKGNDAQDARDA